MDYLEKEMYETLRSIGINHENAILMARIRADMKRRDWLEQNGIINYVLLAVDMKTLSS